MDGPTPVKCLFWDQMTFNFVPTNLLFMTLCPTTWQVWGFTLSMHPQHDMSGALLCLCIHMTSQGFYFAYASTRQVRGFTLSMHLQHDKSGALLCLCIHMTSQGLYFAYASTWQVRGFTLSMHPQHDKSGALLCLCIHNMTNLSSYLQSKSTPKILQYE